MKLILRILRLRARRRAILALIVAMPYSHCYRSMSDLEEIVYGTREAFPLGLSGTGNDGSPEAQHRTETRK
jgi:hypothetical protein